MESSKKTDKRRSESSVSPHLIPKEGQDNTLYNAIHCFILRRIRDPEEARDLVQESWLRLSEQIPPIVAAHVRAWLYRTARNLIIDTQRRRKRSENQKSDLFKLVHKREEKIGMDPVTNYEIKEENQMILESVQQLDPVHQEVLRLKFQEGLSYQEIAEIVNKPKTTVAWLLHESLVQLRKKLASTH